MERYRELHAKHYAAELTTCKRQKQFERDTRIMQNINRYRLQLKKEPISDFILFQGEILDLLKLFFHTPEMAILIFIYSEDSESSQ